MEVNKYDEWLKEDGPAAIVIREHLMPVEGHDGVVFPATYAPSEDKSFKGGYNIDELTDGMKVCLIDSVGSQANRIEPIFMKEGYKGLVPQIVVKVGDKSVNLLEAGHRVGDAIMRCSELQEELRNALKEIPKGNAEPLAKIAPTSLIFGVWDSRDTQTKLPRLIASTIRAFGIQELRRSASYAPPIDHIAEGNIPDYANDTEKNKYSKRGWLQAIPSGTPGGIIATNGIQRDAILHLAALRQLGVTDNKDTLVLRRYILGLALTAFTYPAIGYLRQGCNLVLDPNKPREFVAVSYDGKRQPVSLSHDDALTFAKNSSKAFGIDPAREINMKNGPDREVSFSKEFAQIDISDDENNKKSRKRNVKSNK